MFVESPYGESDETVHARILETLGHFDNVVERLRNLKMDKQELIQALEDVYAQDTVAV